MQSLEDLTVPDTVRLRRGSLRITRETCDLYFAGLDAVVLLAREGALHILPVRHAGGGGSLLKVVNARGDRVVYAAELLRRLGVDEVFLVGADELELPARWSSSASALVLDQLPGV